MVFKTDLKKGSVSFTLPRAFYSMDGLKIAAHIFESRSEVSVAEDSAAYDLTLKSKRRAATEPDLETLGGEFLNELLNQEYRFLVSRFNKKISNLIVTQALLAARGGEKAAEEPAEERTPAFKAEVERLIKDAEDEVKRTMPKKLAPQGLPLPPAREELDG